MHLPKPLCLLAALAALVASGCGEDAYDLAPVSGVVTLDEEPLAGAVVVFQPISSEVNPGPGSTGTTDEQGRYTMKLQTREREPGAVVGQHKVSISLREGGGNTPSSQDVDTQPVIELVPPKYNYRTELSIDVPAEGRDDADFHLKTE